MFNFKKKKQSQNDFKKLDERLDRAFDEIQDLKNYVIRLETAESARRLERRINEICNPHGLKATINGYLEKYEIVILTDSGLCPEKIYAQEGYVWELEKILQKDTRGKTPLNRIISAWKWDKEEEMKIKVSTSSVSITNDCNKRD